MPHNERWIALLSVTLAALCWYFGLDTAAYAHDCVARIKNISNFVTGIPQAVIEDCMRTGYAQAIATAIAAAIAAGLITREYGKTLMPDDPKDPEDEDKTKPKKWALETIQSGGLILALGVVVYEFYLTDLKRHITRKIIFTGIAAGLGIGTNRSAPGATIFETNGDVEIDDFAGRGRLNYGGFSVIAAGYTWGAVSFNGVRTKPRSISISSGGAGGGTATVDPKLAKAVGIGGGICAGTWRFMSLNEYFSSGGPLKH